jgi:ribosome-binding protein aMBF1 (putative translation factor)
MIRNERQYRITNAQAERFLEALRALESRPKDDPLCQIERAALQSQLDELREELKAYDRLRSGRQRTLAVNSFDDLPRALVQARIAAGLSQKELAERLMLKEQQIQRYEATDYATASLTRLRKVMAALGVTFRGRVASLSQ